MAGNVGKGSSGRWMGSWSGLWDKVIANLRRVQSFISPGRELHANKFLSEIVEVLTVSYSGETERNINLSGINHQGNGDLELQDWGNKS